MSVINSKYIEVLVLLRNPVYKHTHRTDARIVVCQFVYTVYINCICTHANLLKFGKTFFSAIAWIN